jgi:hypothetical protein
MLPDRQAALREARALLRDHRRVVFTAWEFEESPAGRDPLGDVGQLVKAAGLRVLLREEHHEWLERQNALYEAAIAADHEDASPRSERLQKKGDASSRS